MTCMYFKQQHTKSNGRRHRAANSIQTPGIKNVFIACDILGAKGDFCSLRHPWRNKLFSFYAPGGRILL
jgi:signal recognition particle subunit SEC65